VTGLSGVAHISAGGTYHTCASTSAGVAYCWGNNDYGRLGDGTTAHSLTPVAVTGLTGVAHVDVGGSSHACAVTTSGAARCWGRNFSGGLGDGSTDDSPTPVAVTGLTSIASLSASEWFTCATTTAGEAFCWGRNEFGTLGDGTTTHSSIPVAVLP
jgi:alpha-tubulin suppressor-like RCC1 family protein